MKRKIYGVEEDNADKTAKRGCLLNAANSNAIEGAAEILSSFSHSKNVEGSLVSIAGYVISMEESLYGLTVGPFLNTGYRNRWRKRVEAAASLSEIKAYLLEFERNIRDIAFATDWIRHVDDTGSKSQLSQSAKSVVGSVRKPRKPSIVIRKIPDVKDLSTDFAWWRGGMPSKHTIKHAAKQGGCKKINGVHYVDSHKVLKRSKQFIWRTAVDLSQTASELALQVSYLDLHVRWNELVSPEQPLQDGKGLEAKASAFNNACIMDKKLMGNKLCYGVVFEYQKDLPSRVLEKVLKAEETKDKKLKHWFYEMHIPLYLIKEYEKVAAADVKFPESNIKPKLPKLSKKQLKASGKNLFSFLEHKRENMGKVFCTFCQRDVSFGAAAKCSACQGYCHDECAVGTYDIEAASRIEFLVTCNHCHIEKDVTPENEIAGDSLTSPLLLQDQDRQHSTSRIQNDHERPEKVTSGKENSEFRPLQSVDQSQHSTSLIQVGEQDSYERPIEFFNSLFRQIENSRIEKKNSENRPLQSVDQSQHSSSLIQVEKQDGYEKPFYSLPISSQPELGAGGTENSQNRPVETIDQKPEVIKSTNGSKKKNYRSGFGLIWKKRNPVDMGDEFRENSILLKGNPFGRLLAPKCHLCKQPYNSELMYILCEKCNNWFHADSVNLQESQIRELYGYKCCKCRRIAVPICPHTDPATRVMIEAKKEAYSRAQQVKKNSGYDPELDLLRCFEIDDALRNTLKTL